MALSPVVYGVGANRIMNEVRSMNESKVQRGMKRFNDIDRHWARETIGKIANAGIINGYSDGTFKPEGTVQVNHFLKMVVLALDHEVDESKGNHWSDGYIEISLKEGLITPGEFNSYARPILRKEMARIITKALQMFEGTPSSNELTLLRDTIKDFENISSEYQTDILTAYGKGLITGSSDGNFNPLNNATRAHAATVVLRLLDKKTRVYPEIVENVSSVEERVNEDLQTRQLNRTTQEGVPKGMTSSAKHQNPQTYEELIENIETMKVHQFSFTPRDNYEVVAFEQIITGSRIGLIESTRGAILMEFPNIPTEISTIRFQGTNYNQLFIDEFSERDYAIHGGYLIKDGEMTSFTRIGSLKGINPTRPYFSVGKTEEGLIYKADYIAFNVFAKDVFSNPNRYEYENERIVIVFENPFKHNLRDEKRD